MPVQLFCLPQLLLVVQPQLGLVQSQPVVSLSSGGKYHVSIVIHYIASVMRNGVVETTANVPESAAREATLSGLSPSTLYVVQVAAVNGAGIGPYRSIYIRTEGKCSH